MSSQDELEALAEDLKRRGEDGLRLRAVERARSFKRSWVEMGEVLVRVRSSQQYLDWGFQDFYAYCLAELRIKRVTVEKLTLSYQTLEQHAPTVLQYDGVAQQVPAVDSVDYFARALREPDNDGADRREELAPEVLDELRHAVFEEGAPVNALRRRFDPILKPTTEEQARAESIRKVRASARKLRAQIASIEDIDGELVAEVDRVLEQLERSLEPEGELEDVREAS